MFVNLDRDSGGTPTMPQLRVSAHNTPWDGIERMVERIDPVELIGSGQGVINLLQNPDNLRKFDAFAKLTLEMDGQDISGILNALGSTNGSSGDRPCPKLTDILIIDANCLQPALIAFAEGRFAQGGSSISFSYIVKRRHCGPHFDKWMWRQVEEKFELANFVGKFSYELHYDDEEIQPVTDMLVPDAM
ncbi:hypothetical protein FRC02_010110 [Tulasnella sp. 418]|nr:hypothetical protein FRC02_010110 [Tulasnella sp. 418]